MTDAPVRGLIAALSREGVIGVDGRLPWHYPADLARFRRTTVGATVIMGRRTWESLPRRPLPDRRNLVVSARPLDGVEVHRDLDAALRAATGDVWVIGGAQLYAAALGVVDRLDLTHVPDSIARERAGAVTFPPFDREAFDVEVPRGPLPEDPRLEREVLVRRRR